MNAVRAGESGCGELHRPPEPAAQETAVSLLGYSSEAEAARALVGLDPLPLIGLGRLQWLASRIGESARRW
jgi:hypothetical protein